MRRVLLVGQPNVGKSSLLNALTGARVEVSNFPGTTVEVSRARAVIGGVEYEFVDTPGVYNLYPSSLEEEVTEKALLTMDYDFVIVVVDATAVERGMVLLAAVAELGAPMIVAFNFWEEAEEKGIIIDYRGLEEELGVPVVRVNPLKRNGISELVARLGEARRPRLLVRYDDHVEEAIRVSEACIPEGVRLSRRGLAVRLVEGDPLVWRLYGCKAAEEARRRLVEEGHDPYRDVENARAGYALELARRHVRVVKTPAAPVSRLDRLFTEHPWLGAAAGFAVVSALVAVAVYLGGLAVGALDRTLGPYVDGLVAKLEGRGPLGLAAAKTVEGLYGQYAAALPYVFAFYTALILLEEAGLLARVMVWMYSAARRLGLQPKAFIPALLGLGCSVPAVAGTRVLPTMRQRLAAAAMLAFIPCSSRATIVFGVAGRAAGAWAALLIYAQGFLLALLAAWLVSRLTGAYQDAVMVEDLPPLRRPNARVVAEKAWARLREFILLVTPLVAAGGAVYGLLAYYQLDRMLVEPFKPIASLLGVPAQLLIPLAYGFIQKDLVISMMSAVLGTANPAEALTPRQALAFTMASVYQVPCIIAFAAMAREFGLRRALLMLIALDAMGLTVAALYVHLPLPL